MKKKHILALQYKLATFPAVPNVKITYALAKNLRVLNTEVEIIKEVEQKTPEFIKYEEDRISLCEKYAEKDDKGNPIKEIVNGREVFKMKNDDKKIFEAEFKKLDEVYIEGRNKRFEDDIKIELHKIKTSDIESLEPKWCEYLLDMLDMMEEEKVETNKK
jgi:hypothetical protein